MHYIRFLKSPHLTSNLRASSIVAKITITTDLGDSFLTLDVRIIIEIVKAGGNDTVKPRTYLWKGSEGMRELDLAMNVAGEINHGRVFEIMVRAVEDRFNLVSFESVLGLGGEKAVERGGAAKGAAKWKPKGNIPLKNEGGIVPARSPALYIWDEKSSFSKPSTDACLRFFTARDVEGKEVKLSIMENTGESIARHIWDAGLLLSAYLAVLSSSLPLLSSSSSATTSFVLPHHSHPPFHTTNSISNPVLPPPPSLPSLPNLTTLLACPSIHIIELGTGVGIVGLTLSAFYPNISSLLLTDVDEAMEILKANIQRLEARKTVHLEEGVAAKERTKGIVKGCVWDWSERGMRDGEVNEESKVGDAAWDLIVVADCTYNSDVVPDLVRTLKSIVCPKQFETLATRSGAPNEVLQYEHSPEENEQSNNNNPTQKPPPTHRDIIPNIPRLPQTRTSDATKTPLILLAMKVRHDSELIFFELMADAGFVVMEKCVLPLPMLGGVGEEIEVFVFGWGGEEGRGKREQGGEGEIGA